MGLFQLGEYTLHSGQSSDWKIECDALTEEDWATLAYVIQKRCSFQWVEGVPFGGLPLAKALEKYVSDDARLPILVVDDVLTTGRSMEEVRERLIAEQWGDERTIFGVVVFARGKCPDWIQPLFRME